MHCVLYALHCYVEVFLLWFCFLFRTSLVSLLLNDVAIGIKTLVKMGKLYLFTLLLSFMLVFIAIILIV